MNSNNIWPRGLKTIFFLAFFLIGLSYSCSSVWDSKHLLGEWKVSDWIVVSSGKAVNQKMDFSFTSDKKYTVDYGQENEKGSYYISGEFLHTKEEGSIEKSVRIIKLNPDSLMFEMNRAGSLERVTLIR